MTNDYRECLGPERYDEMKKDAAGMIVHDKAVKDMDRSDLLATIGLAVSFWEEACTELRRRTEFLLS